jgi:hypothetical protein
MNSCLESLVVEDLKVVLGAIDSRGKHKSEHDKVGKGEGEEGAEGEHGKITTLCEVERHCIGYLIYARR